MRKTILSVVLILTLVATGFVWFRYVRTPSASAPAAELGVLENETLKKYRKLKNLNSDTSVLQNPFFQSLSRPGSDTPLVDIPRGRANPFAAF